MKINVILLLVSLSLSTLASCQDKAKMNFSVEVVDDEGKPVPTCEAGAIIFDPDVGKAGKYRRTAKMTDAKGIAYFSLLSGHSRLSCGAKAPKGYYRSLGKEFFYQNRQHGVWQPDGKVFKVVLKRKKNPIAMYAKRGPEYLPKENRDMGYDLVVGDWVNPDGKGKVSDILFRIEIERKGEHVSTSWLTVNFPGKGNGMIPFEAPVEAQMESVYRSGYEAPLAGYVKSLRHTRIRQHGKAGKNTRKRTMNYYIRVRTKLDKKGKVISAHYGKIYGDFMKFTHYLNPTPNDRNVEFDPQKNLIDTGSRGFKVQQP